MKFLCSAVVLLTAISKTSASGYFDVISPLDPVKTEDSLPSASSSSPSSSSFEIVSQSSPSKKEGSQESFVPLDIYPAAPRQQQKQELEKQPLTESSGPSYFSFSSRPSMTSKPVPALSPKPALRENDLAAKTQAARQGGRENEQPRSVVYSGSRSSSGPNDSSSSSPSMSSSVPPKQPKSIMDTAYDNLHEAVYNNDGLKVRDLLRISPFIVRSSVFAKSSPSRNSELLYEVLMSMKSELSPYDFKEHAKKLLPHLGSNTRSALEAIISA